MTSLSSAESTACPICEHRDLDETVTRAQLPAMQNYVFRHLDLARQAKAGSFALYACPRCGFAFNAAFDPALLDYDAGYDNNVPSSMMDDYYRELATRLCADCAQDGGLVVDVGCGKGRFLKIACELFPQLRGLGIDPSYEGEPSLHDGRLRFVPEVFHAGQLQERPALVVCRHVLEHIPQPLGFLQSIAEGLAGFPDTSVFFEVPDTRWIVEQRAFWDFCYEHCNYFDADSLATALQRSGFTPGQLATGFHNQYLWAETRSGGDQLPLESDETAARLNQDLRAYAATESTLMSTAREKLRSLHAAGDAVAIWGMATKGVVFSFLIDPECELIDCRIDINTNKQGGYVPLTGQRIDAPEALSAHIGHDLTIFVMNPNYLAEIRSRCETLGLRPDFVDAAGTTLN